MATTAWNFELPSDDEADSSEGDTDIVPTAGATAVAPTAGATPVAPTAGATPVAPTAGATPVAPTAGATDATPEGPSAEGDEPPGHPRVETHVTPSGPASDDDVTAGGPNDNHNHNNSNNKNNNNQTRFNFDIEDSECSDCSTGREEREIPSKKNNVIQPTDPTDTIEGGDVTMKNLTEPPKAVVSATTKSMDIDSKSDPEHKQIDDEVTDISPAPLEVDKDDDVSNNDNEAKSKGPPFLSVHNSYEALMAKGVKVVENQKKALQPELLNEWIVMLPTQSKPLKPTNRSELYQKHRVLECALNEMMEIEGHPHWNRESESAEQFSKRVDGQVLKPRKGLILSRLQFTECVPSNKPFSTGIEYPFENIPEPLGFKLRIGRLQRLKDDIDPPKGLGKGFQNGVSFVRDGHEILNAVVPLMNNDDNWIDVDLRFERVIEKLKDYDNTERSRDDGNGADGDCHILNERQHIAEDSDGDHLEDDDHTERSKDNVNGADGHCQISPEQKSNAGNNDGDHLEDDDHTERSKDNVNGADGHCHISPEQKPIAENNSGDHVGDDDNTQRLKNNGNGAAGDCNISGEHKSNAGNNHGDNVGDDEQRVAVAAKAPMVCIVHSYRSVNLIGSMYLCRRMCNLHLSVFLLAGLVSKYCPTFKEIKIQWTI